MIKANANLELSHIKCAELERWEKKKVEYVAKLKKALEDMKAKYTVLEAEKVSVEVELD